MKTPPSPKPLRCAIYTRKSTEHNLDLAFNSLDAQREACEAYVKSQAHEGWRLLTSRYDDGGLSGASLDRPALQQLLAAIRARQVDVVVVYKVDRLTRSLADFAKLVDEFDAHEVAFVSVTQSFNTTSSMGRLTLNVLLSFAQFEREVIGERVRDKIAASKRKGLWVGGPVPLGYRSVNKTLQVVPEEAETVRTIFERYLAVGSIRLLIEDLHQRGITPRPRARMPDESDSQPDGGVRFMIGPLGHILRNRFYVGEVVYRGEVHTGQHPPIVDRATFEAVQQRLQAVAVVRTMKGNTTSFLLAGRLYDDQGNRMTPSHANKRGVRYRYYVSQAVLQNRMARAGTIQRVSAPDIESAVVSVLRRRLVDAASSAQESANGGLMEEPLSKCRSDHQLIAEHVARVIVGDQKLAISLADKGKAVDDAKPRVVHLDWQRKHSRARKGAAHLPTDAQQLDPRMREQLLAAIGRARGWMQDLLSGTVRSIAEIADREGKGERHVRLLLPLAYVSPRIVAAIIQGEAPGGLTVTGSAQALPFDWAEQGRHLGFA